MVVSFFKYKYYIKSQVSTRQVFLLKKKRNKKREIKLVFNCYYINYTFDLFWI
jgi:hypothetical protein